jgi:phosphoglycerate dehydrogenase-like enzyme
MAKFRVGITSDFLNAGGQVAIGDIGLGLLDADPLIEYEFFTPQQPYVTPEQIRDYDGIVAMGGRYTRETLRGNERLAVIGRFGVGYDTVDLAACTEASVILFNTPDGVRRPVATSIMALILALSLRMLPRHQATQAGRADEVRQMIGTGLVGKTLGSVGCGNIGRELFRLAAPFGMRCLAYDPFIRAEDVATLGVGLVDLRTLLGESDFLCINCPLQPETYKLVGARELALMKPTAYLVNTARGPIVDTDALAEALREGRLAGAGLDVTDPEPLPPDHALFTLENVIVTSHRLCWTEQLVWGLGSADMQGMIAVAHGRAPASVVNKEVLVRSAMQAKLERYRRLAEGIG